MPRLSKIQIASRAFEGAPRSDAEKKRTIGAVASGAALLFGAALAGALWMGASLFNAQEAFHTGLDRAVAAAGFKARIEVEGVEGARKAEIEKLVMPQGRASVVSGAPTKVKARVESLEWVQEARVSRYWPSTIQVSVVRRQAFALWQENGIVTVIDSAGERVHDALPGAYPNLPKVVGAGAGPVAAPLLVALEELPDIRARLAALVRVNDRRWNLHLKSGLIVALPEREPIAAMARLEAAHARQSLLDRDPVLMDMREPGKIILRPLGAESPGVDADQNDDFPNPNEPRKA
jgi:cell division protein FtsQ